jgi:histidinol dehydrogenase
MPSRAHRALPPRPVRRGLCARDRARRALRAGDPADRARRPVRAGRQRAAALDRADARRAGAARRLQRSRAVHAAARRRQRRSAVLVAARCAASAACSSWAARRRSRRWPTAPSVPKCDKLFGPGNAWVTEAKLQVASIRRRGDRHAGRALRGAGDRRCAAPMPSSSPPTCCRRPSTARTRRCCWSPTRAARAGCRAAKRRLLALPRARDPGPGAGARAPDPGRRPRQASRSATLCARAPDPARRASRARWLAAVRSAGSVFLGDWAPEALGDYCSGTNHVLPTYGARAPTAACPWRASVKLITVQEVERGGPEHRDRPLTRRPWPRAEGLIAHERRSRAAAARDRGGPA